MISFLEGKVEAIKTNCLIIEVSGIGYQVNIPSYRHLSLKIGDKTKIYTYLYLREDKIALYGFLTLEEEIFFELIISTPGIGPKVGLNVLSEMTPEDFKKAILQENMEAITAIAGIGNKLAKKIILELKEKISKSDFIEVVPAGKDNKLEIFNEAIEALKVLGYTHKRAESIVEQTQKKFDRKLTLQELVRESLKNIK